MLAHCSTASSHNPSLFDLPPVMEFTFAVCSWVCYLDAQQQLLVGHLHSFKVVLHFPGSLNVFLHAFDVIHRRPQYSAFVPAHIAAGTTEAVGGRGVGWVKEDEKMTNRVRVFPQGLRSAAAAAADTHRSLVLGIMVPSSLMRSLMLNLLLLSTAWDKRKGRRDRKDLV